MVLTIDQLKEIPIQTLTLHIKRALVDYKKLSVVALVTGRTGLFSRANTIPLSAIREVKPTGIVLAEHIDEAAGEQFIDSARFGDLTEREVFTERKRYLGRLVTYKLDTDTGLITALWVKPPLVLRDLWRQILLISRSQIVEINQQAIIVDEAVIKSALKPATAAELNREAEASFGTAASTTSESSNA